MQLPIAIKENEENGMEGIEKKKVLIVFYAKYNSLYDQIERRKK